MSMCLVGGGEKEGEREGGDGQGWSHGRCSDSKKKKISSPFYIRLFTLLSSRPKNLTHCELLITCALFSTHLFSTKDLKFRVFCIFL